jgi:hypothetical protein
MSKFEDQTRTCVDCDQEFTWTAGEQEFFHEKGFSAPPKRCQDCRRANKERRGDQGQSRGGQR